jgi:hypothetical protein
MHTRTRSRRHSSSTPHSNEAAPSCMPADTAATATTLRPPACCPDRQTNLQHPCCHAHRSHANNGATAAAAAPEAGPCTNAQLQAGRCARAQPGTGQHGDTTQAPHARTRDQGARRVCVRAHLFEQQVPDKVPQRHRGRVGPTGLDLLRAASGAGVWSAVHSARRGWRGGWTPGPAVMTHASSRATHVPCCCPQRSCGPRPHPPTRPAATRSAPTCGSSQ